jgi:hypothetical protein
MCAWHPLPGFVIGCALLPGTIATDHNRTTPLSSNSAGALSQVVGHVVQLLTLGLVCERHSLTLIVQILCDGSQ